MEQPTKTLKLSISHANSVSEVQEGALSKKYVLKKHFMKWAVANFTSLEKDMSETSDLLMMQ